MQFFCLSMFNTNICRVTQFTLSMPASKSLHTVDTSGIKSACGKQVCEGLMASCNDCVSLLFFRDCACSVNDEVELVQTSDNAHGCCEANGGQWLDCYSSPRRISLRWKLHGTRQQERCLRRDQKQVPEWNRQDPTWVPGKTQTFSNQPTLIDVILNNDFGIRFSLLLQASVTP